MPTHRWMRRTLVISAALCCRQPSAPAAEIKWVPVGATGQVLSNDGSEIVVAPDQRVFLEVRVSGWGPDQLSTWQGTLDAALFGRECAGGSNPGEACFTPEQCFDGGVCTATVPLPLLPAAEPCTSDADCEAAFDNPEAMCNANTGSCAPGWQDRTRTDVAIPGGLALVDTSRADFRYGATIIPGVAPAPDGGEEYYGGSLAVDVLPGSVGSVYTIGFISGVTSFLNNQDGFEILPLNLIPATIIVMCTDDAQCDNGVYCDGQETCVAGACVPGAPPCPPEIECDELNDICLTECSVPADCDDGNECTENLCPQETGRCSYPPELADTPCGDPVATECDAPDTCDGAGTCLDNFVEAGTACGDPTASVCDNADICDGLGSCSDNFVEDGTFCETGDPCLGGGSCEAGNCVQNLANLPPVVSRLGGGLNILVTPQPENGAAAPISLRLRSSDWPCLEKYIDADGSLVDDPVEQLPIEWGTVLVSGPEIVPESQYEVVAICDGLETEPGIGNSAVFGDLTVEDGDNTVDFRDISLSVGAFLDPQLFPLIVADIAGQSGGPVCPPNRAMDFTDISLTINLFLGDTYASYCDGPCP